MTILTAGPGVSEIGRSSHAGLVPEVDIADDTYVARPPEALARTVADPLRWRHWWPDLDLRVTRDRGAKGVQWAVRGALTGSMEIWLEPVGTGTVLHWYLRADPATGPALRPRRGGPAGHARLGERRVRAWKAHAFALKDAAELAEGGT